MTTERRLTVQRAAQDDVPDLVVEVREPFPWHLRGTLGETKALHRANGVALADALYETLPGGTFDQMMSRLMERAASQFIIRHRPPSEG